MTMRTFPTLILLLPLTLGCGVPASWVRPESSAATSTSNLAQYEHPMAEQASWSWTKPWKAAGKLWPFGGSEAEREAAAAAAATNLPNVVAPDDPLSLRNTPEKVGPDIYIKAAQLYETHGNLDRAASQYQLALKVAPQSAEALVGYARLLDRQGKFDEAVATYRRAAEAQPENASIHNDLGLCLARHGQIPASLESLQYAVRLRPQETLYRNNTAKVLVELGRPEESLQHLLAVHPAAVAHYNLGYLLYDKQQREAAAWHFHRALELDPSLVKAQRMLQLAQQSQPVVR